MGLKFLGFGGPGLPFTGFGLVMDLHYIQWHQLGHKSSGTHTHSEGEAGKHWTKQV